MTVYPVGLLIEGVPCLVFGGGPVAERKVRGLLEAGARVSVVSPEVTPGLKELQAAGQIEWYARLYRPGDESGEAERPLLVFAATSDADVNAAICARAAATGVLANRADRPEDDRSGVTEVGRFAVPAALRRGDVCVAVFTGGDSPGLAAMIRDEVAGAIGPEYGEFARLLRSARKALRREVADSAARRRAMAALMGSPEPLRLLRAGARQEAVAWIARTVDETLAQGPADGRPTGEVP